MCPIALSAKNAETPQITAFRDKSSSFSYVRQVAPAVGRILASVDLNPFGPSYGCCDRQYWHYRTAAFPSEMYQEAALPLALAFRYPLPGDKWQGQIRLAEAATAALRFSMRSAHGDGSCDDYYPQERALGAAVFSLQAATEAYRILELDDRELLDFFVRRARWIARHDEAGRLTNHHALAALAMWRTGRLAACPELCEAARERVRQVVDWQSTEGWFPEYDGADPGYQTVTVDCLAKLQREAGWDWLAEPLERAVGFCRHFLHLDDSYGGPYGSRGTRHFYPHGMELLAGNSTAAADLADGYLRSLANGTAAQFDDDRMYVHAVGNLLEAYRDWSPMRPEPAASVEEAETIVERHFPQAGLFVSRSRQSELIASTARGGCFLSMVRTADGGCWKTVVDGGLVVEFTDGRTAVSQTHGLPRDVATTSESGGTLGSLTVSGPLSFVRFERATPGKQAILHLVATSLGSVGRGWIRRLLQRRVIHGRQTAPVRLSRTWRKDDQDTWRVHDIVELTDARAEVRRLAFAAELQAAYTAASNIFQNALLNPWHDLEEFVDRLNRERWIEIVREFTASAAGMPQRAERERASEVRGN